MLSFANIPPTWQQVCKDTAYVVGGGSAGSFVLSKMGQSDLARLLLILSIGFGSLTNLNTLNTHYFRANPRRMIFIDAVGRFLNVAITLFAIDKFLNGSPKVSALLLIVSAIFLKINYNKALNRIVEMENQTTELLTPLNSSSQIQPQDKK